jgi:hypothetical protein
VCKLAEVPVKRVQSFVFYGADALPKLARKGVERGVARTHGRGVREGGFTWAILYGTMFPPQPSYHRFKSFIYVENLAYVLRVTDVQVTSEMDIL